MKRFSARFYVRENGELNQKLVDFDATSKTAAVKAARNHARAHGWRFVALVPPAETPALPPDSDPGWDRVLDAGERDIKQRLEYLRAELRAERISYGELHELQSLVAYIDPADTELLEAAGAGESA